MNPGAGPVAETAPEAALDHAFVVPAFGDSPFLDEGLASLRAQTRPGRVVVATSTPSAAIEAAAARHGAELRVNPRRGGGIGADWNFALDAAGRRYVTLAHQDDLYRPAFTARTLELFARRPEGVLAFTGADHIDEAGRRVAGKVGAVKALLTAAAMAGARAASAPRRAALLAFGNPVHCSSVTFDTARLPEFRFAEDLGSNLDWEAWWRLHRAGGLFLYARERLVARRYHRLSETSHALRDGRRAMEDLRMFEAIWPRPVARAIALAYQSGY